MSCKACDIHEENPVALVHACRCRGEAVVLIHKKCAKKYYSRIGGKCENCNAYFHELFNDGFEPISLGSDSNRQEFNVIENIIQFVKTRQRSVPGIATLVLLSIVLLFVAFFLTLLLLYFVAFGSTEKDEWDKNWSTIAVINYILLSFALITLPHQPKLLNILNRTPDRRHFIIKLSLFAIVYDLICVVIF